MSDESQLNSRRQLRTGEIKAENYFESQTDEFNANDVKIRSTKSLKEGKSFSAEVEKGCLFAESNNWESDQGY